MQLKKAFRTPDYLVVKRVSFTEQPAEAPVVPSPDDTCWRWTSPH